MIWILIGIVSALCYNKAGIGGVGIGWTIWGVVFIFSGKVKTGIIVGILGIMMVASGLNEAEMALIRG